MNRFKRTACGLLLCVSLGPAAGCGVELAVLGAAASAASSGSAAYKRGKLVGSWMGPFDLVVAAGEVALSEMGYAIYQSNGNARKGEWTIVGYDDDGGKVVLTVDRKTSEFTEFQINVGWFGREPTARLILKRMAVAIDLAAEQDGTGDVIRPLPIYPALQNAEDEVLEPATETKAPGDEQPNPDDENPPDPASAPDRPAVENMP